MRGLELETMQYWMMNMMMILSGPPPSIHNHDSMAPSFSLARDATRLLFNSLSCAQVVAHHRSQLIDSIVIYYLDFKLERERVVSCC